MNMKTKLTNEQHHAAGKAMQEIIDRLYILQENAGTPEEWVQDYAGLSIDWVQEKATELQQEFKKATGIDLGEF
jgi:hypothetical protein